MIKKLFKQMLISQIISAMAVMLCLLIDSIMIGRFLGVKSMAAYGYSNPVLLIFAAFGSFMSTGIQVVCSKAMGSGDEETIHKCYSTAIVTSMSFAFTGVIIVVATLNPLCTLLGAKNPEVHALTKDYLKGFIFGAPAFIMAQILVPFLQMSGERVRLVVAVLSMTVADIAFDLLNVFVLKEGTFGMGVASALSYYIAIIIGGSYLFKKRCFYKFGFKRIKKAMLGKIANGGIPTIINQLSLVLLVFIINKVLTHVGGELAVAAYSIISTIANIGYCLGNGISEVTLMLTGMCYSEEDRKSLSEIVKEQNFFAIVIDFVAMLLFLVFAKVLVRLFIDDNPQTEQMAISGLKFFAICLIPSAVNAAFKKYYQAIGMIHFSESISFVQNLVFPGLVVLIMGHIFEVNGVWTYYLLGEILSFVYITIGVYIYSKKRFASHDSYVCLPDDFGPKPGEYFEYVISDKAGVQEAVDRAGKFCREKGIDKKKTMYTCLCIEEMANNIVDHGFGAIKNEDNRIFIRLMLKNDGMIIRIRDNCLGFDPVNYYEMSKPDDDPSKHIGIKMIFKMVKNVQYVNSLGLNNLILEI